jgi:hypothetical protein
MSKTLKTLWQLFHKAHGRAEESIEFQARQQRRESAGKDPNYTKTTIRLPTHLVRIYKHLAIDRKTTMQDLVAAALAYYLEKELKIKGN